MLCFIALPHSRRLGAFIYLSCNVTVDADDVDRIALIKVFTILQHNDPRDGIIYVAATGDVPTLRKSLEKYPEEVHVYSFIPSPSPFKR